MFEEARWKLTAWYLVIIMIISGLFSIIIYNLVARQIESLARPRFFEPPIISYEIVAEHKEKLVNSLVVINGVILLFSGGAGYFLAGRTLQPIKEMMDEQNQFISDASHELRTPIATLRAEMEGKLMEKNISNSAARKLINSNLEELDRLQRLSEGLLKITRVHTPSEKASISETVQTAIKKIMPLALKKNIQIESKLSQKKTPVEKDRMLELLTILLDNSIKYSPENTKITVASRTEEQKLKIMVQDQGIGIPPKDLPFIFERFYRADKSRSATSGYGLGLAIAKKIADNLQGEITAHSQVNKGTVFEVTIPV